MADQLATKGWDVGRQQHPASVHLTVNARNAPAIDEYLDDLKAAVATVKANPELKRSGEAAMYGMMAKVPVRGLVKHSVRKVMEGMYAPGGTAPDMANLGQGDDDGLILGLINKYGDQAQAALDKLDAARDRLKSWLVETQDEAAASCVCAHRPRDQRALTFAHRARRLHPSALP